jgi:hypothetical protein
MSIFKWHSYWIVLLLFLFSCGKSLPSFEDIDLQAWKNDKHACDGTRSSSMKAMESQSKKLLALSQQEVIALLGKPDENELYKRNQKFFYYFVQPAASCTNSDTNNPKKLVIRFNAMGLAKEVSVE